MAQNDPKIVCTLSTYQLLTKFNPKQQQGKYHIGHLLHSNKPHRTTMSLLPTNYSQSLMKLYSLG